MIPSLLTMNGRLIIGGFSYVSSKYLKQLGMEPEFLYGKNMDEVPVQAVYIKEKEVELSDVQRRKFIRYKDDKVE